jgi:hypothetical protein
MRIRALEGSLATSLTDNNGERTTRYSGENTDRTYSSIGCLWQVCEITCGVGLTRVRIVARAAQNRGDVRIIDGQNWLRPDCERRGLMRLRAKACWLQGSRFLAIFIREFDSVPTGGQYRPRISHRDDVAVRKVLHGWLTLKILMVEDCEPFRRFAWSTPD